MKNTLAGLVAGVILGSVPTGFAASSSWSQTSYGIMCKADRGSIACVPTTGKGYGVGINKSIVVVVNLKNGKFIYKRLQP